MFRLCKEILLLPEEEIRKIEITYFCLTVLCSCYIDSPRIAFFTDKVFKDEMAIDMSMATIFLICGPISAIIFYLGRGPFSKALRNKKL